MKELSYTEGKINLHDTQKLETSTYIYYDVTTAKQMNKRDSSKIYVKRQELISQGSNQFVI